MFLQKDLQGQKVYKVVSAWVDPEGGVGGPERVTGCRDPPPLENRFTKKFRYRPQIKKQLGPLDPNAS